MPSGHGEQDEGVGQNHELHRRKTIAERMARLGGVNFGAPGRPPPPSRREVPEIAQVADNTGTHEGQEQEGEREENEDEARTRRAAIAARIASQGGMRFGMIPGTQPKAAETSTKQKDRRFEDSESVTESSPTSDDGTKVQFPEESEAQELGGEASMPPSSYVRSPLSGGEAWASTAEMPPPLPSGRPGQRHSVQGGVQRRQTIGSKPVPAPPSRSPTPTQVQGEYILVDEPEEVQPPPRPARPLPNRRSIPPIPLPTAIAPAASSGVESSDLASSQWELPAIPTSSLELDGSHSDDDTVYPASPPPPPKSASVAHRPPKPTKRQTLSADGLMALWGRVGTQVLEQASSLVEKSKKSVIGDGSAEGFVREVLAGVPHVSESDSFGHLVFSQTASTVQKRSSDIMPGDVIALEDAKFKGYKGLSSYSIHVGTGGNPLTGIIHEFEPKKSKIRVFQATLAPNQYPVRFSFHVQINPF